MPNPVEPPAGALSPFAETADIETASDGYASRFATAAGGWFLEVQRDIVLEMLQAPAPETILDVGGGHGQLAVPLVRKGYDVTVTGSDDTCRRRLDAALPGGGFSYRTCDHLQMPFADQSFDAVLAFRLLPHVRRWRRLLSEMCRVARHVVLFDYPDRRSTNLFYDALFAVKKRWEGNTRTFLLFSRAEIARELTGNGFGRVRCRPQFFLPMVIHRRLNRPDLSAACEAVSQNVGLTGAFGSPVIVRAGRQADRPA
jgi:SAM-dependent methyltransferase